MADLEATTALHKTPLHDWHAAQGGRIVPFGGWSMPVQYQSILTEHRAVRTAAGLFDISHMGRLDFQGPDALAWLEKATTNHVAKLAVGQIQYSLIANGGGGILDDVLVYHTADGLAMVCNASNREPVQAALTACQGDFSASVVDRTFETGMIALQGPRAAEVLGPLTGPAGALDALKYYHCGHVTVDGHDALISRTGYTGEDGFELIVPRERLEALWATLLDAGRAAGVIACGLGARDTLRLEAAMPLYGHELSATTNPYAAGLGWAVKLDKGQFVGRDALTRFKGEPGARRVGLTLGGKRIARQGATVHDLDGHLIGEVTSGTYSTTLEQSIAMAYVPLDRATVGNTLTIDIRGHREQAQVVPLPFYKRK